VGGSTLPSLAGKPGQGSSQLGNLGGKVGGKPGQSGFISASGDDPSGMAPGGVLRNTLRNPSGDSAGRGERGQHGELGSSHARAASGSARDTSPELTNTGGTTKRSRPSTATGPRGQGQDDEPHRFVAKGWGGPSPSEEEQRRMADELKRRVFDSVLAEERKRQEEHDEEEQNALAARWELQGQGDLMQLIRRIDDTILRRDMFRMLKTYVKRSPTAMEVVCAYCRRKPRRDQIHSFDLPSRPASASRLSTISLVQCPAAAQTCPAPGAALTRVSSTPNMSSQKAFDGTAPAASHLRRGRPPKLVAMLPTTGGLPATPGLTPSPGMTPVNAATPGATAGTAELRSVLASALDGTPPIGWAPVDAAC